MTLSNIKIERGVDLFNLDENKDIIQKANAFAKSGLIDDLELKNDILEITGNRKAYMAGNMAGLMNKLRALFRRQKVEVLGKETCWFPVSLYRAYCPEIEGATVKLICSNTHSKAGDTSIEILGIGGGPTFSIEFSSSLGAESSKRSFAIDYEFQSHWEHVRITEPKGNVKDITRLVRIDEQHRKANLRWIDSSASDLIHEDIDQTEEINSAEGLTVNKVLTIKSGSELKVSGKFKFEQVGIEVGTEITTANQFEITYEYSLPGGKSYQAYHPANAAYWLWKVNS